VTLLRRDFYSLSFPPMDLKRRADSRWALSQISSCCYFVFVAYFFVSNGKYSCSNKTIVWRIFEAKYASKISLKKCRFSKKFRIRQKGNLLKHVVMPEVLQVVDRFQSHCFSDFYNRFFLVRRCEGTDVTLSNQTSEESVLPFPSRTRMRKIETHCNR